MQAHGTTRPPGAPLICNRARVSDDLIAMAELPKRYDPKTVEPKWYQRWIDDRDFVADAKSSKPPFSVVMPPPNITGVLTLGHVLNNTIQDILARRARMQRFEVLWLPGMDHAGIGTQTAVEKHLRRTENKTRHYFGRYEIVEEPGRFLEVATTRPETIMADTAMAFHPGDKRYLDLLGKHAWRPLARERIPIIADDAIDPEFGTGVLKVTPAHDAVDFEIGQRHDLPTIDVLTPAGRINCPTEPELDGLDRFKAREKAADLLEARGALAKTEPYESNDGSSDRTDVPVEPRITEEWFLRCATTTEAIPV